MVAMKGLILIQVVKLLTPYITTKGTTLTVENYKLYQDECTTKGTSNEQPKDNERYTKEERKHLQAMIIQHLQAIQETVKKQQGNTEETC